MRVKCEATLARFRGPGFCAWCNRYSVLLHPHHLVRRGMGSGSRLDVPINLLSLDPACHDAHHKGHRPLRCDLLAVKAAQLGMLQDALERRLWEIVRCPKGCALCVACGGKGCLFCGGAGIFDCNGDVYREAPRRFSWQA